MAAVVKYGIFAGEQWDTPPNDKRYPQIHKLVNISSQIGEPAMHKLAEYIEEHPDELESVEKENGDTPLFWAARYSNPKVVQLLIDHGANLDARNRLGITAIILAAWTGRYTICKVLIDAGADLTIIDNDGNNVFTYATNYLVVRALLEDAPNNPVRMKALERKHSFSLDRTSDPSDYMTVDI